MAVERGIYEHGNKYRIQRNKKWISFDNYDAAKQARLKHVEDIKEKEKEKKRKRKEEIEKNASKNASKRQADLEKYGNNMKQHYEIKMRFVNESPETLIDLHDFTKANIYLRMNENQGGRIKILTTEKAMKKKGEVGEKFWQFNTNGDYTGILVACYAYDLDKVWIFDGKNIPKDRFGIYDNEHKWNKMALQSQISIKEAIQYFKQFFKIHPDYLVNEDYARNDMRSDIHIKEKKGIDLYKKRFEKYIFKWPNCAQTSVDLIRMEGNESIRQQHKTLCKRGNGFTCSIEIQAGRDANGKRLRGDFSKNGADEFVFTHINDDGTAEFWIIPVKILEDKGNLQRRTITCHRPDTRANLETNESVWTKKYYMKHSG